MEAVRVDVLEVPARCESPLERIFLDHLWRCAPGPLLPTADGGALVGHCGHCVLELRPQVRWRQYRVDLFLTATLAGRVCRRIAIECDGHSYHERTPEQAAKDRARDRRMLSGGLLPLRYTAGEILDHGGRCARDLWGIVEREVAKALDAIGAAQ